MTRSLTVALFLSLLCAFSISACGKKAPLTPLPGSPQPRIYPTY